jgi:hypothetical protein
MIMISAEQKLWDEVNIFDEMIAELKRRREERISKIRELKTNGRLNNGTQD